MAQATPFSLIDQLFDRVTSMLQPPAWLVNEVQHRGVLLINHVLMQEPEALQRLARQKGRTVLLRWREFTFRVQITPAGLFELAAPQATPDLQLEVPESSPWRLAQAVAQGEKPAMRIEGDVQLAAEINWLADNVRWDMEEDLARVLGDAPAHRVAQAARTAVAGVRQFLGRRAAAAGPAGTAS